MKKTLKIAAILGVLLIGLYFVFKKVNLNPSHSVGEVIDSLNNVEVYYNGVVRNIEGRNVIDGYNIGMKYQCVEFVKRYYFEQYNHKMPDTYGNAKDFFIDQLEDGKLNKQRDLYQYSNPSYSEPKVGDLIVMSATTFNKYGHVAIVSKVDKNNIEIIQQNPSPFSNSRETFPLENQNGKWNIMNNRIDGSATK
ncbi:MAG: CHAP domain-containing protein [Flavobacteriaceae bacterium]|nr:CHAP domain-containing protein [Flavobacteriaceae bacterium]